MPPAGQHYKVKLASGRVLGPIDLERVRLLILKNQITGVEQAREHPNGDWVDINSIREIADLLVARASGTLNADKPLTPPPWSGKPAEIHQGTTRVLTAEEMATQTPTAPSSEDEKTMVGSLKNEAPIPPEPTLVAIETHRPGESDGSVVMGVGIYEGVPLDNVREQTKVFDLDKTPSTGTVSVEIPTGSGTFRVANQETIMFENPLGAENWTLKDALKDPRKMSGYTKNRLKKLRKEVVGAIVTLGVVFMILQAFSEDPPPATDDIKWVPVKPTLPSFNIEKADPKQSLQLQSEALKYYVLDTVPDYKTAVKKLTEAARFDPGNVKALGLLASSYLNLIDSSNKDEKYFEVLSKIIELSRAKDIDLPETVIADVEFYIVANKAEAAQNRIIEYTKTHQNFDPVMFFYMALSSYHRGDIQAAARYVAEYPEAKAFSAKLFYLRGQIAEKFGDYVSANREYEKAIQFNKRHAKSHLAIARLRHREKQLQNAAKNLKFITENPTLLAPPDLSYAYYLQSQLFQLHKSDELALAAMERAVKLSPDNHEYLLELYSLRAKAGANIKEMQSDARMYFFLGEGEKFLRDGNYADALSQFLQARQANDKSYLPFVKIGDMFRRQNDLGNARLNYKTAAERAPKNIEVWSKYIDVLIQSYEWEEAKTAMDRFRKLPVNQSAIDKAAADMYAKMGQAGEAQTLYRKAMSRETIDSSVYIAYAKSLMDTKNFKEAPFFLALALRFDPLNYDALIATAKCVAATEGIDRAISMLQDELQKGTGARAELLAAIADFQAQKGAWLLAQNYVDQAIAANPEYAYPWKVQAQIWLSKELTEKGALDKALDSYQSYADRNPSDPSGYLERYKVYYRKGEFDKASEELGRVFAIYPKYPNLHFLKASLYATMGNHKAAIEELNIELKNNPNSVPALILQGKEYVQMGAVSDSLNFLNKAMQLSPKNAEAKAESAYSNYLLKNYQGAIALYSAALGLDKGNPTLYKRIGMAYRDIGDTNNARMAFKKYLEMEPDAPDKGEFERYR